MRKKLVYFTCGLLMTALMASGCAKAYNDTSQEENVLTQETESGESSSAESGSADGETSEVQATSEETVSSTQSGAETSESDSASQNTPTYQERHLDAEWLERIKDYRASLNDESGRLTYVYVDGIRGGVSYDPCLNDEFYFKYHTLNGEQSITLTIQPESETARLGFDVSYDDSRFYAKGEYVRLDQLEFYVDAMFDKTVNLYEYDDSALKENPEQLKNDVKILYSRLIAFSDQAFSDLNTTLEDYGVYFGEKYRDFDPTQPTSTEIVIKNEHDFENGVCKDCGMTWTKYMNRTLAAFTGETVEEDAEETEWFSAYGQDSYDGLPGWGYEQYISEDIFGTELSYVHPDDDTFTNCVIYVSQESEQSHYVSLSYNLKKSFYAIGEGVEDSKYDYWLYIAAAPGDFAEIFSSKEALRDACELSLGITDENEQYIDAWETMSEEEIKALFEADGCVYHTKDEFFDIFWEQHETIIRAIDKGMVWFDTSLKDCGFNYQ